MNRAWRIVDTSGRTGYPEAATEKLAGIPCRIESRPLTSAAELIARCTDADALLVTAAHVTRDVLDALPRLRCVVRYGVGLDRIDLDAARQRGVAVHNTRGFCTEEMAEHALALMFAFARDLFGQTIHARTRTWGEDYPALHRLSALTLGLVGLGAIGRALARRAAALGMRVLAYDPQLGDASPLEAVTLTDLASLLRESDFVSLHCPLTPATRTLIGERELDMMKSDAVLINTARGGIVDEPALVRALRNGRIAGAALDVLAQDPPPPDHPLLTMENVIVTPHTAWVSEEAARDLVVGAFEQLAAVLKSLPVPGEF